MASPGELTAASPLPDVMNDPAFATNTRTRRKSVDEQDTCRICRGEGTAAEPLFYPCKCSGSIKFVHQECLMEWLSHSQKKHCELCKTTFRFTKLYHPQMPQTLPTPIFLRELVLHAFRAVLTWLRFLLVAFVWLGWLPWSMRAVWRGLFWVADGTWIVKNNSQTKEAWNVQVTVLQGNLTELAQHGTTPKQNPFLPVSGAALIQYAYDIVGSIRPGAKAQLEKLIGTYMNNTTLTPGPDGRENRPLISLANKRPTSWLSDVAFLQSLTPSPTLNNIIIDTLEGQIITILVVVAFILVFLIREWVVQQQPVVHAAADGEGAEVPRPRVNDARGREVAQLHAQLRADRMRREAQNAGERAPETELVGADLWTRDVEPETLENDDIILHHRDASRTHGDRVIAVPRARMPRSPAASMNASHASSSLEIPGQSTTESPPFSGLTNDDGSLICGAWEEAATQTSVPGNREWPGVQVFMDLWRRSGGDPDEVVRLIREEDREAELGWIVLAMQRVKARSNPNQLEEASPAPSTAGSNSVEGPTITTGTTNHELPGRMVWQPFDPSNYPENLASDPHPPQPAESVQEPIFQFDSKDFASTNNPSSSNDSKHPVSSSSGGSTNSPTLLTPSSPSPEPLEKGKQVDTSLRDGHPISTQDDTLNRINQAIDGMETVEEAVNRFVENSNLTPPRTPPALSDTQSDSSMQVNPGSPLLERPNAEFPENIAQWLWAQETRPLRQFNPEDGNDDERIVQNFEDEEPFVPFVNNHMAVEDDSERDEPRAQDGEEAQDREAVPDGNAPAAAVNQVDVEAAEDAEDLEGIFELIGMQGPMFGLLQNGVFSALLISITVAAAIWFPYLWGKVALLLLAHPLTLFVKIPLQIVSLMADTVFDLALFMTGSMIYWVDFGLHLLFHLLAKLAPPVSVLAKNKMVGTASKSVAETSLQRLTKSLPGISLYIPDSDFAVMSILCHQALETLKGRVYGASEVLLQFSRVVLYEVPMRLLGHHDKVVFHHDQLALTFWTMAASFGQASKNFAKDLPSLVSGRRLVMIGHENPEADLSLNYDLVHWNTKDRILTVVIGYLFFTACGILYLKITFAMPGGRRILRVQGIVADILHQAGGVMKVILIIGIEMIVFPLYCGLLLDLALLPLFERVTLISRVSFTLESPCTSLFVHWFIGTCYMFHFALFVSMCRKIMRSGVLYFIRDPDDPTFHPVRDVLERNISTQLRKIAFSALVYGALVILCLGGVVWGLAYAFDGVLPIHWSSNEPVLEFPVDLLFYNFLMPLAIRIIRPSDGLHKMYDWWFHKCARLLRISEFLLGERREDEEGHHVRRTWQAVFRGIRGDVQRPVVRVDRRMMFDDPETEAYFVQDGRFVRTPASDQVRIPKGSRVFLEVDRNNDRVDGEPDRDDGLHGKINDMFKKVYIPPYFRLRIVGLVILIWLFAASTGLGVTILPLVFGRRVFTYLLPSHIRMNDVYAFSIGMYILGGLTYATIYARISVAAFKTQLLPTLSAPRIALSRIAHAAICLLRLIYVFSTFTFLFPSLIAILIELYFVVPLHTYFSLSLSAAESDRNPPIIHFIQDWTLGVLYTRMIGRLILSLYPDSLLATALRGIVSRGWLDPDIRLMTRGFILPATSFSLVAITSPLLLGWTANFVLGTRTSTPEGLAQSARIYRYSFPGVLALVAAVYATYLFKRQITVWKMRIRDEVYLIGERLHNFGEKRASKTERKGKARADLGRGGRIETH